MKIEDIVHRFVDSALEERRQYDLMRLPIPIQDMAQEMVDSTIPPDDDWIGWKPVPSTVVDSDLDELQTQLGMEFPPAYRAFLKYLHFYELTETGVRFCPHPVGEWRSELTQMYRSWYPDRIVGVGLIPFGDETMMDAGPVCFDTRDRLFDGDCPVVFWDHEWVRTEKEVRPMFSSCVKMFECLAFAAQTPIGFVYHRGEDPEDLLSRKKELMTQFLNIDPEGAGGPAREYWTCWGVNPDA